jgi:hypothetical protein
LEFVPVVLGDVVVAVPIPTEGNGVNKRGQSRKDEQERRPHYWGREYELAGLVAKWTICLYSDKVIGHPDT